MKQRSILVKMLALVLIAALAPMVLSANSPYCAPPNCQGDCPDGTWDCTQGWLVESWENFQMALFLWWHGYSVLACCRH